MRIEPKKLEDYPFWLRWIYRREVKKYGQMLTPAMVWGRMPRLFALIALALSFFQRKTSPIDPVVRSLVMLRIAQLNWCDFCVDLNATFLIKATGSAEKHDALENWRESTVFSGKEKISLEYAEMVTLSDRKVDDKLMDELKKHFDDDAVVELTALISFQNLSSKFNSALDLPSQGLCKIPKQKPAETSTTVE